MGKKMIKGIHHVALNAKGAAQYNKVLAFYTEVLGLEILRQWGSDSEGGTMIDTGAGIVEIFVNEKEELTQGAVRHFAFATDCPDECIEAVRKAGYEVTVEPKDVEMQTNPTFPIRVAFCIGPVGEEIEFFQER